MMNTLMPVEVPLDMITLTLEMAVPKTLLSWKSSVEATYRHHCNPPKTICGSGNGITQAKVVMLNLSIYATRFKSNGYGPGHGFKIMYNVNQCIYSRNDICNRGKAKYH